MSVERRMIDYLCNAFTPDRAEVWDAALRHSGDTVKIRRTGDDGFAEPEAMVDRMDALGIDTLLLPTGDLDDGEFTPVAARWSETATLVERWPGRFAALALIDPRAGMEGVRALRARLADEWVAGLYLHTHSFDVRFDAADLYPSYATAADASVPVVMQAGVSGGPMPSECGRPIGIDRPALYFRDVDFVLSHTGWPWVDEAIAMARTRPNVYVGTASYPPRHWPPALTAFLGSGKVVLGTNFPTVGHRQLVDQIAELGVHEQAATMTAAARKVFTRLQSGRART
jgi:predicted TIM-barrel fold metal-dependent hydrolase